VARLFPPLYVELVKLEPLQTSRVSPQLAAFVLLRLITEVFTELLQEQWAISDELGKVIANRIVWGLESDASITFLDFLNVRQLLYRVGGEHDDFIIEQDSGDTVWHHETEAVFSCVVNPTLNKYLWVLDRPLLHSWFEMAQVLINEPLKSTVSWIIFGVRQFDRLFRRWRHRLQSLIAELEDLQLLICVR
jgi:hypothetical protein